MITVPFQLARRARWSSRRWAPALALCALVIGLDARAQQALTLDQALRLAQERSRQRVAQDAGAAASRQMAVATGQLPDLVLKTGLNSLPISGPDPFISTSINFRSSP